MGSFIKSVTRVPAQGPAETLYRAKKQARGSGWLKPIERRQRRFLDALVTLGGELRERHDRSKKKRRDGWLKDGPLNLLKAQTKALKKLFNL